MTDYIIPILLAGVALFALGRKENVYEELLTGAAGGLKLLVSRPFPLSGSRQRLRLWSWCAPSAAALHWQWAQT